MRFVPAPSTPRRPAVPNDRFWKKASVIAASSPASAFACMSASSAARSASCTFSIQCASSARTSISLIRFPSLLAVSPRLLGRDRARRGHPPRATGIRPMRHGHAPGLQPGFPAYAAHCKRHAAEAREPDSISAVARRMTQRRRDPRPTRGTLGAPSRASSSSPATTAPSPSACSTTGNAPANCRAAVHRGRRRYRGQGRPPPRRRRTSRMPCRM